MHSNNIYSLDRNVWIIKSRRIIIDIKEIAFSRGNKNDYVVLTANIDGDLHAIDVFKITGFVQIEETPIQEYARVLPPKFEPFSNSDKVFLLEDFQELYDQEKLELYKKELEGLTTPIYW